jgi:hypothetical protein
MILRQSMAASSTSKTQIAASSMMGGRKGLREIVLVGVGNDEDDAGTWAGLEVKDGDGSSFDGKADEMFL